MNRKQRRAQDKKTGGRRIDTQAPDYAALGAKAYHKGDNLSALEMYARAVEANPKKHDHKVCLAHILRNVSFESFNLKIKELITICLLEKGVDYQDLSKAWYSTIMCDPAFILLRQLVNGKEVQQQNLQECLGNKFLLLGLSRLTVHDVRFEKAMLHARELSENTGFNVVFADYCKRVEYVFCDFSAENAPYYIDDRIKTLGCSGDVVSKLVQNHYEENPYPRWSNIHVQSPPKANLSKTHNHLIAGCGTGFGVCGTAMLYPNARITAIDLSRASLTYAKGKAKELGLKNISFYQGDILNLNSLDQKFDIIECSGVLHHMDDPLVGWKSLLAKLKEGGRMNIGLYSELGRRDVVAARAVVKEQGFTATHASIKAAREYIANLPDDYLAKAVMSRRDFYSLSDCRDLIFHEQEYRFTIPQIKDALDSLGLNFNGFDKQIPSVNTLDDYHKYEQENPDTFKGMYQFWCSRS